MRQASEGNSLPRVGKVREDFLRVCVGAPCIAFQRPDGGETDRAITGTALICGNCVCVCVGAPCIVFLSRTLSRQTLEVWNGVCRRAAHSILRRLIGAVVP
jgi:hypothetical protein